MFDEKRTACHSRHNVMCELAEMNLQPAAWSPSQPEPQRAATSRNEPDFWKCSILEMIIISEEPRERDAGFIISREQCDSSSFQTVGP